MKRLLFVLMCLCMTPMLLGENLLVNPGFETGDTTGWGARFGIGSVEAITENPDPHSGDYCGRDFGREANWHGIWQSQNMRDVTELGVIYPVSVWLRTNTPDQITVAVTMQYEPTDGTVYNQIGNIQVDDTEWVNFVDEYEMLDNDSTTATFYIETTGGTDADIAEIYVDDAAFGEVVPTYGPSDPMVTPLDEATGAVGNLADLGGGNYEIQDVVLAFVAAGDPNELADPQMNIHPDILQHNIYLQTGAPDDPNLYLYDSVIENIVDPFTHDPNVVYGPLPNGLLEQATTYQWQVEEVLDNGSGGFPAGDPNNILGPVWSFTTASATPAIASISDHQLTDANGDAALTVTTGAIATDYRWYQVVGVQDTEEGESDDIQLTDGGLYSGTQTVTLVISGMAADGSDDARYYAIAYNGDPDTIGIPSAPSAVRWVWYPRLVNQYTFEAADMTVVDGNTVAIDSVSGYNMTMLSNDTGEDVPAVEPNVPAAPGIAGNTNSLKFDNPRADPEDPNNVDAQYAQVYQEWAGSYKDITISAWVYSNGSSNWNRILDYGNDNGNYMMICVNVNGDDNDAVRLAVNVGGDEQTVTAPNDSLPDGEWTHVVATLSGDTGRVYINGELAATNADLTNDPVSYGPTTQNWLGRSQWGAGDGYFNGMIDQLKIYNYGLTTVEVGQEYLADTLEDSLCNLEIYDQDAYDVNGNCIIDLPDFAAFAARWLENDRIYPAP